MKKTILTTLLLSVILFSGLAGKAINGVTIANKMLVFSNKTTYISLISKFSKEERIAFVNEYTTMGGFTSLLKNKETSLELFNKVNDDFFSNIINDKGYIQIESNIYKVNPFTQLVYVFPASRLDLVETIDAGIISDNAILAYSMNDDVIGMVSSGTPPSNAKLFCGESGVGERTKTGHINCTSPSNQSSCNWMDCSVMYNALGIYFALKAKCVNTSPCRIMYWHKTPAAYKVKCGYTYGPVYQWDISSGGVGSSGWSWNEYFYQNVQPLNGYWLRVVFMAKDPSWIGNPDNPSVDLEIRVNM